MKRTQRHGLSTEQCLLYHSSEGEQTKEVSVLQRRGQVVSGGEGYLACSHCGGNFTTSCVKLQLLSMFSALLYAERARRKWSLVQMWCLDVCTFAQELSCTPRYRSMHTAKVNMIQLKNWWMRNRDNNSLLGKVQINYLQLTLHPKLTCWAQHCRLVSAIVIQLTISFSSKPHLSRP